jgi:hypothetical protein
VSYFYCAEPIIYTEELKMIEKRTINCKDCKQPREAFLNGKLDERNKRWVDVEGKLFAGRVCPQCKNKRVREKMAEMRFKRRAG